MVYNMNKTEVELYLYGTNLHCWQGCQGENRGPPGQCGKTYLLRLSLKDLSKVPNFFFRKFSVKTDLKICSVLNNSCVKESLERH